MKIKEMLETIIDKGKTEDMYKLNEMLDNLICDLKQDNPELYQEYKDELYEMAYGCVLNQELAEEIVRNMKPYGMKWTMEQTNEVKQDYGIGDSIRKIDFFVVMNSAYNDFHNLFDEDISKYVEYTKSFIKDEDAVENKVYKYFTKIAKKN